MLWLPAPRGAEFPGIEWSAPEEGY
jgi:hypothetical protein